jgi:hypothetical protein
MTDLLLPARFWRGFGQSDHTLMSLCYDSVKKFFIFFLFNIWQLFVSFNLNLKKIFKI